MNDDLYKITCHIQAKITEKQEEVIMQSIQEIGGDKFYEITFDRNKVIEALTMYKNKDKYAEVVHGEWIDDKHNRARKICSICFNSRPRENDHEFRSATNYCPNCGAKMDGGKAEL